MMSYIDNSRAKEIEAIASDVLSDIYHGEISLPIDLGSIAKAYNIQLKTAQFEDRGIAGEYDRPSETIVVSGEDDFSRQTFTIAHEMGHHFLHREKSSDTLYRLDVLDLNRQNVGEELEANIFAASLLMPRQEVIDAIVDSTDFRPRSLARRFGVSHSAMIWRLKTLGIDLP